MAFSIPRFCILSLILALLLPDGARALEPVAIHFIDVGEGDAILITAPGGKNILVDAGNLSAAYKLKQYLVENNVSTISALVITHMHSDHVSGLFSLYPGIAISKIYDNGVRLPDSNNWREYTLFIRETGMERGILESGDRLKFGDLVFHVVSPSEPLLKDDNANSIVMRMSYGAISVLLTGDLNEDGERRLDEKRINLKSRVLKVGHHGDCDGTSDRFLDMVAPDIAVISTGKNNRYGRPCGATLARIRARGITLLRTDRMGAIVMETDGETIHASRPSTKD